MAFNWIKFLRNNNIPYLSEGRNIKHNNIGMACPLCAREGNPDPSAHLGINPSTGAWNCWRNSRHGGRSPVKLIQALLNCSWEQAQKIADEVAVTAEGWQRLAANPKLMFSTPEEEAVTPVPLEMPPNFRKVRPHGITAAYAEYLRKRGFPARALPRLYRRYKIMAATSGFWAHRIIFPVFRGGQLVCWTSRVVRGGGVRYMSLSSDPAQARKWGQPQALANVKDVVWNGDELLQWREGGALIVCEGPFDALKLDFYGRRYGLRATCVFGLKPRMQQVCVLAEIAKHFDHVYTMQDTIADSAALASNLALLRARPVPVPDSAEDAGALSSGQVRRVARRLAKRAA